MAGSRSLKRQNPLTLVLGLLCLLAFLFYMIQPSTTSTVKKFQQRKTTKSVIPSKAPKIQRYSMEGINATADPLKNREKILILTPLARFYDQYWQNLLKLDYPRELIELGFITPKTRDGNAATKLLNEALRKVQTGPKKNRFAKVTLLRQDFETVGAQSEKERHAINAQKNRRSAMSKARNSLVFTTLNPSISWVLWLDSDIIETPHTLIQDLALHDKAVIVPNCFQRYKENGVLKIRPYDFNSWHDSEIARNLGNSMGEDDIILEGYSEMATYRALMAFERNENGNLHAETPLDGVGGTALMVKASIHRDGAMFPPFAFYHLIETEGFAKMVRRLGHQPYGLPNYLVYHYNE